MVKAGDTYGRLTVLGFAGHRYANYNKRWFVRCECGTEKTVSGYCLAKGETRSCGCLRKDMSRERSEIARKRSIAIRETAGEIL